MENMIREYICVPPYNKVKNLLLVSGCLAAAVGMLAVAETGELRAPWFRAVSAVWVLAAFLFASRLLATGYVYSILRDPNSGKAELLITELRFGKSRNVCRVSLFDIKEMKIYDPVFEREMARREGKKRIKRIKRPRPDKKARVYNYCVDILPARYCLIFVAEGAYVKFSPDERMMGVMHNCALTERGFNGII